MKTKIIIGSSVVLVIVLIVWYFSKSKPKQSVVPNLPTDLKKQLDEQKKKQQTNNIDKTEIIDRLFASILIPQNGFNKILIIPDKNSLWTKLNSMDISQLNFLEQATDKMASEEGIYSLKESEKRKLNEIIPVKPEYL